MPYLIIFEGNKENPLVSKLILLSGFILFLVFVLWRLLLFAESFWVEYIKRKPPFRHFYLWKRQLKRRQLHILKSEFSFYNRLSPKEQRYFEHRVAVFIYNHSFDGRGMRIDDRVKVLISATAIMLTFGYRDYDINSVNNFIIYPKEFFSRANKAYHKGEFNLGLRTIVFSWENFLHGYDISNDNFNLGIHEYVHAMHLEFANKGNNSPNAVIFMNTYHDLVTFLDADEAYKQRLVASRYLRDYAYTNTFEFVAVLIESFMETPEEFKAQFPEMYAYVKQMLNFNFAGY